MYVCTAAPDKLDALMPEFVRDNAGKAFEFMVETADEDRKAAGLGTIAEMFAGERTKKSQQKKAERFTQYIPEHGKGYTCMYIARCILYAGYLCRG